MESIHTILLGINAMHLDTCKSLLQRDELDVIRIDGTKVTLDAVVFAFHEGASPEEISARFPDLSLEAVYAAIAFYLQNRAEIGDYLSEREAQSAELRKKAESMPGNVEFRERLLARARAATSS